MAMGFKSITSLAILVLFTCLTLSTQTTNTSESLVLVHALFRHGDRTPSIPRYPTDPYKYYDYLPFGSGQLTNQGKRREYSLGKLLRKRYSKFLGALYTPYLLEARTTDIDRTKMSILLVLAALFPPKGIEKWDLHQNWQPIPYIYQALSIDEVLGFFYACPNFLIFEQEQLNSSLAQNMSNKYADVLEYTSVNAGFKSTNLYDASIYFTLETEQEAGLELPKWTSKVYPEPLRTIVSEGYLVSGGTTELRQIGAGYLLQKILTDTIAKIKHQQERKLFLYSAHDINVALMLITLGVFKPHIPPYGACILFEIHYVKGEYGVKIFYENYENIQTGLLTIPGCEEFCPLDQFISIVAKYLPQENICGLQ